MKACQRSVAFVYDARRIDNHQLPEDRGARWKSCGVFEQIIERQIIRPCKRDPVFERLHRFANLFLPKLFNRRSTDHHGHIFRVRQDLQDALDCAKIIYSNRDNGVMLGQSEELNATFFHRREHHGYAGKELRSVTLDKGSRRRTNAYNEIRLLLSEQRAEVTDEMNLRVFILETSRHKRMVSDVQLPRRLPLQFAANGLGIFAPRLEILPKRMQEHDPLGLGRSRLKHREQKESDSRQANSARPAHPQNPPLHMLENPRRRMPFVRKHS